MENGLDFSPYVAMLRRRWPLIIGPLVVCTALSLLVAVVLPPRYTANALILVESQQIPEDLARSTVTAGAAERIQLIEQRLMTRETLLDVAGRFPIFPGGAKMSPNDIVGAMRLRTEITSSTLGVTRRGSTTGAQVVRISFSAERPTVAAQVANEFVTRILEQNIAQRSERASETLDFFDAEVERLGGLLQAAEERISAFRRENVDALPESFEVRRAELTSLRDRIFAAEARRDALQTQRAALKDALENGGDPALAGATETPEERELGQLERTLAQQSAIFADSHPNIRVLKARIEAVRRSLTAAETPPAGAEAADGQGPETGPATTRAADLRRQMDAIDDDLSRTESQIARDTARAESLEAGISRTPDVDIRLQQITRERDLLQAQFQQASVKRAEAQIGQRLEVNQKAERFEVIEQALPPEDPDAPNRKLIAASGVIVGGGLGVSIMLLIELINKRVRTMADLERALGLRAVVSIPYIHTVAERRRRRWMSRITVLAALIVIPLALYYVDQNYQPLPQLAERLMRLTRLDMLLQMIDQRFGG